MEKEESYLQNEKLLSSSSSAPGSTSVPPSYKRAIKWHMRTGFNQLSVLDFVAAFYVT